LTDLADAYSAEWFRRRAGYRAVYHRFAETIEKMWRPRSLLDVGCGAGYIVEYFAGRIPVLGVDGSPGALAVQSDEARRRCILCDLTCPPPEDIRRFEFAVSIEVAEHIPAEHVGAFLRWFEGARRVLLTAAPPGQGGTHHVNEQPPAYWQGLFAARGFRLDVVETEQWRALARAKTRACPWVVRNAMVFLSRPGGTAPAEEGTAA